MAITPEQISNDTELGLRILAWAEPVAPCLQNLDETQTARAVAILRDVAVKAASRPAGVKARTVGDWSQTYFSDAEMQSVFSADDRAALRAMCGASALGRGPRGHFPRPTATGTCSDDVAVPRRS